MIILSVDHGMRRTGVAVCDKMEILATPIVVIDESDDERLATKIYELSCEYKAQKIVVGLPKNMDGSEGESACICREFALKLSEKYNLDVDLYDERLTTVSAYTEMNMADVRGKKRKKKVDSISAVLILEDYMRHRKNAPR